MEGLQIQGCPGRLLALHTQKPCSTTLHATYNTLYGSLAFCQQIGEKCTQAVAELLTNDNNGEMEITWLHFHVCMLFNKCNVEVLIR
jgi:hypothetical protein